MNHGELERDYWKLWDRLERQDNINKENSRDQIWLWVMIVGGALTDLSIIVSRWLEN